METEGILSTIAMILAIIALVGVSYMYATNNNVDLSGVDDNQASILANSNLLTALGLDISSLEDDLDDINAINEDDLEDLEEDLERYCRDEIEDECECKDGVDGFLNEDEYDCLVNAADYTGFRICIDAL